jgi:putative MATE family efflux protein
MTSEDINRTQDDLVSTITEGRIWRAVWALSWPTMISMFLSTAYIWINRLFVGRGLGTDAIDAVGLGGNVLMIIFSVTMGVAAGTTALVARFTGSRSHSDAVASARQSIVLSVLGSVVLSLPFIFLAKPILILTGARGNVLSVGVSYTVICTLSTLPFFVVIVLGAIFRGLGDMKTPLYITGLVTLVNIVGDYVLIFGIGPFPKMGVSGAAVAVAISRMVGVWLSIRWLLRSSLRDSLSRPWTPHWQWMTRILNIAWPAIVQGLMFSLGFTAFLSVIGRLTHVNEAQAAWFVGSGAEAIAYMPGFAFMTAATSLVGQNLGARRPDRAEHGAWICAWQCAGVMSVMALIFYIFARPLSEVFIKPSDPNAALVIDYSVRYLRINAISEPFFGFGMVFAGAMQGAGDTKTPTWISFITLWVLRLPLAYIWGVTYGGHVTAVWIAVCATTALRGVIMTIIFKRGKWKTVQV